MIDVKKRSATLKWREPREDGGTPIVGYNVEYKVEGGFKWVLANEGEKITDLRYEVTGLKADAQYEFRVAALNKAGQGPFAEPKGPVVVTEPIGKQHLSHYVSLIILSPFLKLGIHPSVYNEMGGLSNFKKH